MKRTRARKGWVIAVAAVLFLGLAGVVGAVGCSDRESEGVMPTTTAAYWGGEYESGVAEQAATESTAYEPDASASNAIDQSVGGTLVALQTGTGQKIIANAQVEIEVGTGKFQTVFDQALLLADRYGGYVLSSDAYSSGEEDSMKSGTIAIRIPATSFDNALSDAGKLGEVKTQSIQTEDVTAEYIDLEARIRNSEANVNAILAVLAKAKTVDEILQVQQTLTYAQEGLEQLKGQLRYLDEHTSYSTLTMSIYETGVEVTPPGEWGFVQALKDALHNLVDAFNAVVRGLGWLIPVIVLLGIIAYIIYRIVRAASRRSRERAQARAQAQTPYQSYPPQNWPGPAGPVGPGGPVGGRPGASAQATPTAGPTGSSAPVTTDGDEKGRSGKTS
jgi:hypothetical protein